MPTYCKPQSQSQSMKPSPTKRFSLQPPFKSANLQVQSNLYILKSCPFIKFSRKSMSQEVEQMAENKEHDTSLEQRSSPHEAIFFVLNYLPLFELLALIQVCKSLRDAINNDILPWMNITVDRKPLNFRLSDDILMKVVSKAKGRLQVLALMNCVKITDDGLLKVIAQNSHIGKLHVPSCTSLSPGGVITAVKLLTKTNYNLKSLKINGINGVKKEDLKTIQDLVNLNHTPQQKQGKIFYHKYKIFSTLMHEETCRSVDVDICPRCDEVRMVFDCPQVSCERQQVSECRGCDICVPRCKECGVCLTGSQELEDAACADTLCLECWLQLPKCNFCNKPYCNEHADLQVRVSGSSGFVCDSCHSKFNV